MGHRRKERNLKYTKKVSKKYSGIREMHTRLPAKREDKNRKDYGRSRPLLRFIFLAFREDVILFRR